MIDIVLNVGLDFSRHIQHPDELVDVLKRELRRRADEILKLSQELDVNAPLTRVAADDLVVACNEHFAAVEQLPQARIAVDMLPERPGIGDPAQVFLDGAGAGWLVPGRPDEVEDFVKDEENHLPIALEV